MKLSTRASLLSLFVFPGTGHIVLKRYLSGWTFISIAAAAALVIFISMMKRAYILSEQLATGEIPFNIKHIVETITATPPGVEGNMLNIAVNIVVIVWVASTVDAYRIGKKMDS
ncbi:hypothetical protein ACVBE9_09185 [Eionea flava]